jgi:hypothetical protein
MRPSGEAFGSFFNALALLLPQDGDDNAEGPFSSPFPLSYQWFERRRLPSSPWLLPDQASKACGRSAAAPVARTCGRLGGAGDATYSACGIFTLRR